MSRQIIIAGAGVSGLAAGINLAKAGFEVHVYDRNLDVGRRFFGDLQGLENWSAKKDVMADLASMNITDNFEYLPCPTFLMSNVERTVELKNRRAFFYLVKRGAIPGSIDQGIKTQALEAGVQLHLQTEAPLAQADIIATGQITANTFGIVKGIVFDTSLPNMAIAVTNDQTGWLGYSYLLVMNGYGCLCTVLMDRFNEANACFDRAVDHFQQLVKLDIKNQRNVGGVGTFSAAPQWQNKNQLFVGEASGLHDLLWGYNIRNAITSGWLAAQSIIHGQSYSVLAEQHFKRRIKAGVVNRWLWELAGRGNYRLVLNWMRFAPNPASIIGSFYNYNWSQRLFYPAAKRWLRRRYPKLSN